MSKRTPGLVRRPRDFYPTIDPRAAAALAPHLAPGTRFVEPCAGAGHLIDQLENIGHHCVFASDIEPGRADIHKMGFSLITKRAGRIFITNPPWERKTLHALIWHFCRDSTLWLLFDADWSHTMQAARFEPWLTDIVSVGRLRWLEEGEEGDKGTDPMDNCAWYRFGPDKFGATRFWQRRQGESANLETDRAMEEGAPG
jgi:hypothetical protein